MDGDVVRQHLPQDVARGPVRRFDVVLAGQQDLHVHPAQMCANQGADQVKLRQEVGGHDPHPLPGRADHPDHQVIEAVQRLVGPVQHQTAPHRGIGARRVGVGEGAQIAGFPAVMPVAPEGPFQFIDDAPAQPEVDVQHAVGAVGTSGQVPVADVGPTGESKVVVDDQQLAVTAQVQVQGRRVQRHRVEAGELQATLLQHRADAPGAQPFPHAVDDDLHFHAPVAGGAQGLDELRTGGVPVEQIRAQQHLALRLPDGLQHGRVERLAVLQNQHFVAAGQALAHHVLAHQRQGPVLRARGRRHCARRVLGQLGHVVAARRGVHAVDAEDQVEDGPGQRQAHAHGNPAEGGAGVALVEQGVGCCQQGDRQQDGRGEPEQSWSQGHRTRSPTRAAGCARSGVSSSRSASSARWSEKLRQCSPAMLRQWPMRRPRT